MNDLDNVDFINSLRTICNYMVLNQKIEKCDVIIGCGCSDLTVPIRCSELYKAGVAPKILFTGSFGKITKYKFNKTEAELFKDIAIKNGVPENDIIIENKSTNTGDNFRFGRKVLDEKSIKYDRVLIVPHPFSERRTLSSAKTILNDKTLFITSPRISFNDFINQLKKEDDLEKNRINIIIGDIQRLVLYPQFGWQTENILPDDVIKAYNYIKSRGYTKYLINENEYKKCVEKYGIIKGQSPNFFY